MFGRFWKICLRYMNIFSLCCFFLYSNFLDIISHLSHITASPIITNLFYLFSVLFSFLVSCFHSLIVSYLSLFHVSTYYFFYFRSVYCFFRTSKSWSNICHYTLLFFSLSIEDGKIRANSGLPQSQTHREKERISL